MIINIIRTHLNSLCVNDAYNFFFFNFVISNMSITSVLKLWAFLIISLLKSIDYNLILFSITELNTSSHFTFMLSCIVINFFLITNQMHQLFKFILLQNSTYSGHLPCPSSGVFYCTFGTDKFHAVLMTTS